MFTVEKKKETITESAGRQQKKKIGEIVTQIKLKFFLSFFF